MSTRSLPKKVLLPVVASCGTVALGVVTLAFHVGLLWSTLIPLLVLLGAGALARRIIHGSYTFEDWPEKGREFAFFLVSTDGVVLAADDIWLQYQGLSWFPLFVMSLLGWTVVQVGVAAAVDYYYTHINHRLMERRQAKMVQVEALRVERGLPALTDGPRRTKAEVQVQRALNAVGLSYMEVCGGFQELIDQATGEMFGAVFHLERSLEESDKDLNMKHANKIAQALGRELGVPLETRWIKTRELPQAGHYTLTVTTRDLMGAIYPYVNTLEWADINKPAPIGFGIDANPIGLHLKQHGRFIGKTRGGKTMLIHCALAYLTRCRNVVVWVAGVQKVYDLLAPWLEPYLNTGVTPPIDFVRRGPEHTAAALLAFLRIFRYRQSLRLKDREGLPDIVFILDEAMNALTNKTIKLEFDGTEYTMSEIVRIIMQGGASAGCFLYFATQRDVNDQLGDCGGDIAAQVGFTVAFGTSDTQSIGRMTGAYDLPAPVHKGECYVIDDCGEGVPVLTKTTYIQEDDPSKPVLHDGATISEVALSRAQFPREMDEGSAKAAGEDYLNRPRLVTEELLDYLTGANDGGSASGVQVGAPKPLPSGGPRTALELEACTTMAQRMAQSLGEDWSTLDDQLRQDLIELVYEQAEAAEAAEAKGAPVATLARPRNREDRVLDVLAQAGEPLTVRRIGELLIEAGDTFGANDSGDQVVRNSVGKLAKTGQVVKNADGTYSTAA